MMIELIAMYMGYVVMLLLLMVLAGGIGGLVGYLLESNNIIKLNVDFTIEKDETWNFYFSRFSFTILKYGISIALFYNHAVFPNWEENFNNILSSGVKGYVIQREEYKVFMIIGKIRM
jgi:hypothetical protein